MTAQEEIIQKSPYNNKAASHRRDDSDHEHAVGQKNSRTGGYADESPRETPSTDPGRNNGLVKGARNNTLQPLNGGLPAIAANKMQIQQSEDPNSLNRKRAGVNGNNNPSPGPIGRRSSSMGPNSNAVNAPKQPLASVIHQNNQVMAQNPTSDKMQQPKQEKVMITGDDILIEYV